jgi:NAD(P)-dependent dehydrogenase (short-subunit alcohol dehydrogenase family)
MNGSRKMTALITGASSGIGRASVARMIQAGWLVFATVRKAQDGEQLRVEFGADVAPIIMDVTDRPSIAAALAQVASHLSAQGLDGLVNVAGVGRMQAVEYMSPGDLQEIFQINLFGQIAVTQAFLPLLRKARGRIVNITSVGAHIAIPFGSLINASKSAFNIFSDTLRLELHPFGIHVSAIEPGAIKTPAVEKTLGDVEGVVRALPPEGAEQYAEMLRGFARRAYAREMHGSPPDVVARAVHHALTANVPRTRYRVGRHARLLTAMAAVLPDRTLDRVRFGITGMPRQFGALAPGRRRAVQQRAA